MSSEGHSFSVNTPHGEAIAIIELQHSKKSAQLLGSQGEIRRFYIRKGRRRLLKEWGGWNKLIIRNGSDREAFIKIVAFPTGRDDDGYLRFL